MAPVAQGCVENRIRSFIVLDLETTGLPYDKPVRITEIAMLAALKQHILGYGSDTAESSVTRVLSKLCVFFQEELFQNVQKSLHVCYCIIRFEYRD